MPGGAGVEHFHTINVKSQSISSAMELNFLNIEILSLE